MSKLGKALRCRPKQVSGGGDVLGATGDRGVRVPGELDDLLGVGLDPLGVAELVLLASLQPCPADLLDLMPEQVRPPRKLSFVAPQVDQLPIQASQACPQGGGLTAEVGEACPAVEQLDVLGDPEQGEVGTLAVDVDEALPHLLEHPQRDRSAVDAADIASRRRQLAGKDHDVVARGSKASLLERRKVDAGGLEDPLDPRPRCARADHPGVGASAHQQAHRVDHDRLACPRLPGEGVEAGPEGDARMVDHRQVRNVELDQHSRKRSSWRTRGRGADSVEHGPAVKW